METRFLDTETKKIIMFKSYYVVWKLPQAEATEKKQEEFKSYYVVWKPRYLRGQSGVKTPFKSYYVVWKLEQEEKKRQKKAEV